MNFNPKLLPGLKNLVPTISINTHISSSMQILTHWTWLPVAAARLTQINRKKTVLSKFKQKKMNKQKKNQ